MTTSSTHGHPGARFAASGGSDCLSCGAPARIRNEDGQYCLDCMKAHLLEKSLVQITELARPSYWCGQRNDATPNTEVSDGV